MGVSFSQTYDGKGLRFLNRERAALVKHVEAQKREITALRKLEYKMQRKGRAQQGEIPALKRLEWRGRPLHVTEREFLASDSGMKPQFRLKACPHCGGDLARDRDQYGDYDRCFQCGYVADLAITNQPTFRLSWVRNQGPRLPVCHKQ